MLHSSVPFFVTCIVCQYVDGRVACLGSFSWVQAQITLQRSVGLLVASNGWLIFSILVQKCPRKNKTPFSLSYLSPECELEIRNRRILCVPFSTPFPFSFNSISSFFSATAETHVFQINFLLILALLFILYLRVISNPWQIAIY